METKKLEKQIEFSILNQDKYRLIHTNEIWYRNKKFLNQLKNIKNQVEIYFKIPFDYVVFLQVVLLSKSKFLMIMAYLMRI